MTNSTFPKMLTPTYYNLGNTSILTHHTANLEKIRNFIFEKKNFSGKRYIVFMHNVGLSKKNDHFLKLQAGQSMHQRRL